MSHIYDVIILGGGPAGLSAGIYAGRARLDALIIEKGAVGGQAALTADIENYPGQLAQGETGGSLARRMADQAERFGAVRRTDTIRRLDLRSPVKELEGTDGVYRARSVILAPGARPRPIGCENEDRFIGRGVSYCATCDGAFFRGLDVYVVGGGDSAVEEAVFLTRFARRVTIIHRRDRLRAARAVQERAFAHPGIRFLWDTVVERLDGGDVLESLTVRNVKTGQRQVISAGEGQDMLGLFGFTGHLPDTELLAGQLELDRGYIPTDEAMATAIPGIFAAGDARVKEVRQVITAAADGAVAAISAGKYLERLD